MPFPHVKVTKFLVKRQILLKIVHSNKLFYDFVNAVLPLEKKVYGGKIWYDRTGHNGT